MEWLAITGGSLVAGFVLDSWFGTRARWWYAPWLVGVAGLAYFGWGALRVLGDDPSVQSEHPVWLLLLFSFCILVLGPAVLAGVGVAVRRRTTGFR